VTHQAHFGFRSSFALVAGALLVLSATQASAFSQTLEAWQER